MLSAFLQIKKEHIMQTMHTPHILHRLEEYTAALQTAGLLVDAPTLSSDNTPIDCVSYDSRGLFGKSLFICKGAHFKEAYLAEAVRRGAVAYVSEHVYAAASIPCLRVNDVRHALVVLGQLYYNHITDRLTTVGITGTKGKTTTAFFVRAILNDWLRRDGKPDCAMLSSSRVYDGVVDEPSHMSTPEVLELYQHFQNAADSGIEQIVMEVSSQALKYGRVRGMHFDVGCFTNLGADHISPIEHPDLEDYYRSKLMLFDACRVGCVNLDADRADETLRYARERCRVTTFGMREDAALRCLNIEKRADGIYFTVRSPWYNGEFSITMPGLFNVSNALSAMSICAALDIPEEHVRAGLRRAHAEGRMQVYESRDGQVAVIVDYAHNRLSFDALFRSLRPEWPGRRVISVFGCPGGKALQRRRDMGELGGQYSDYVYITEDDPGEEPLESICAEIAQYVTCAHEILPDREACIRRAICTDTGRRVVVLAAKGEDKYMKRGTRYDDYDGDAALAQKYLAIYEEAHQ